MAETVVSFFLNRFGLFLDEETKLLGGVREEAEFIRDELDRIRVFLRAAEAMEERDPQVSLWVRQVREIAFDIEDVLDEFSLRLAYDRENEIFPFISTVTRHIRKVKDRHQIASKIQGIKSRIISVSEGNLRYKLDVPALPANTTWYERRGDALLLEEAELVGIDKPKKQLIEWTTEDDPTFKVISVIGMGGSGKTTLAKKVYDDVELKKLFKNRCWITVSQSPNIEEQLRHIIRQLFDENKQPLPPRMESMATPELKAIIKEFLQQSRYLLVLDDVWDTQAWDAIKYAMPQNNCGSRVMLTTRIAEVARTSCVQSNGNVYTLEPLSIEDSWTLFCRKTFQGNVCPSHLKSVANDILKRCQGLPLAIVAISGLLATKDVCRIDEWEMVKRNLGGELDGNKLQSLKKILLLSYYDLPYHLKACLLYTSAFPEDYEMRSFRMMRLWIAEKFVEEKDGKTLEEVADGYLSELVNRSLIQVAKKDPDGKTRACRIHDLLREVILSKSKDQNFVMILNEKNNGWHDKKLRRLSIHNSLGGNMQGKKHTWGLRSLLVLGVGDLPPNTSILALFGGDLTLLKVLDLEGMRLDKFPGEIFKLFHLTYLSLRNTQVRVVPASIGKLQNLETLDLKSTNVTNIPPTIVKLHKLRHLIVYRNEYLPDSIIYNTRGFEATPGIGGLVNLQELCMLEVNQEQGNVNNVIEKMGMMTQLRKLWMRIVKLRREDGMKLCSLMEKLTNLRSLFVELVDTQDIIDLQHISSPPRFLERLKLFGCLRELPHWVASLQNLTTLRFNLSGLREDMLEPIQALPNLLHLTLYKAFEGEKLHFKAEGFQRLKSLKFSELQGLRHVEVENGAMPCLELLCIERCEFLEKLPLGIEFLANIKVLRLGNVSENLINSINRAKAGQDYRKIEHVRQVDIYHFEGGKWTHAERLQ